MIKIIIKIRTEHDREMFSIQELLNRSVDILLNKHINK